jgi:hypothetical protein
MILGCRHRERRCCPLRGGQGLVADPLQSIWEDMRSLIVDISVVDILDELEVNSWKGTAVTFEVGVENL